jgi:hypothetical protein
MGRSFVEKQYLIVLERLAAELRSGLMADLPASVRWRKGGRAFFLECHYSFLLILGHLSLS